MRTESITATPIDGGITRAAVVGVNEARRTGRERLTGITAPEELRLEHLALVTTLGDLVAAVDAFLADTAILDATAFATAASAASDLDVLVGRVSAACAALDARMVALGLTGRVQC
jgi:hypothetical protein